MIRTRLAVLAAALMLPPLAALAQGTPASKDAYLYIISPADGDRVEGAFRCRFGLRNMGVTHAEDSFANSGHHHLLIDADEPIDPGEPIPQDKKHLHYGAGETEAMIELPPGKHTLQLVLGDSKHFNFDPPVVSKKITITVDRAEDSEQHSHTAARHHDRSRHHAGTSRPVRREVAADAASATPKQPKTFEFFRHILGMSQ